MAQGLAVDPRTGQPFAIGNLGTVTRLDPTHDFRTVWNMPLPWNLTGFTIDERGFVWMAEATQNQLLRLNPAALGCNLTAWALAPDGYPMRPRASPDGLVWFADPRAQAVGRLDPRTNVVTYLSKPGIRPAYVTALSSLERPAAAFADAAGMTYHALVSVGTATLDVVETGYVGRVQSTPSCSQTTVPPSTGVVHPARVIPSLNAVSGPDPASSLVCVLHENGTVRVE